MIARDVVDAIAVVLGGVEVRLDPHTPLFVGPLSEHAAHERAVPQFFGSRKTHNIVCKVHIRVRVFGFVLLIYVLIYVLLIPAAGNAVRILYLLIGRGVSFIIIVRSLVLVKPPPVRRVTGLVAGLGIGLGGGAALCTPLALGYTLLGCGNRSRLRGWVRRGRRCRAWESAGSTSSRLAGPGGVGLTPLCISFVLCNALFRIRRSMSEKVAYR